MRDLVLLCAWVLSATCWAASPAPPTQGRWSDEGQLLPEEISAAREALSELVGAAKAQSFQILSAGCGFRDCTYVVRRSVLFFRAGFPSDLGVARAIQVPCAAKRNARWSCRPPYVVASLVVDEIPSEFEVSDSLADSQLIALVRYTRSSCFLEAIKPYAPSQSSFPRAEHKPLWAVRQTSSHVVFVLSNGGYGYEVAVSPSVGDCPFKIENARYWIS